MDLPLNEYASELRKIHKLPVEQKCLEILRSFFQFKEVYKDLVLLFDSHPVLNLSAAAATKNNLEDIKGLMIEYEKHMQILYNATAKEICNILFPRDLANSLYSNERTEAALEVLIKLRLQLKQLYSSYRLWDYEQTAADLIVKLHLDSDHSLITFIQELEQAYLPSYDEHYAIYVEVARLKTILENLISSSDEMTSVITEYLKRSGKLMQVCKHLLKEKEFKPKEKPKEKPKVHTVTAFWSDEELFSRLDADGMIRGSRL